MATIYVEGGGIEFECAEDDVILRGLLDRDTAPKRILELLDRV